MFQIKKKRLVDSTDKEILRFMYDANKINRQITGNQIAKKINLSAPAIKPRLLNLQRQGIVKPISTGKMRLLGKRTKAPSRIFWGIDFK